MRHFAEVGIVGAGPAGNGAADLAWTGSDPCLAPPRAGAGIETAQFGHGDSSQISGRGSTLLDDAAGLADLAYAAVAAVLDEVVSHDYSRHPLPTPWYRRLRSIVAEPGRRGPKGARVAEAAR